jgi:hypothetical protein
MRIEIAFVGETLLGLAVAFPESRHQWMFARLPTDVSFLGKLVLPNGN